MRSICLEAESFKVANVDIVDHSSVKRADDVNAQICHPPRPGLVSLDI